MLKALVESGLKRASRIRTQTPQLQHLYFSPNSNDRGQQHAITAEREVMPHQQLFSRSYALGPKYNRGAGDGKGPPTVRQKRIATEVMEVISEALQQGPCYSPVLQRCGFQILRVKMSSDLRTAHILWTALPGMQKTAEKAAISKVLHLRSLVFQRLNLPFSPILKFQEDKPSQEELALQEAFAKLKEEEAEIQKVKESEGGDEKPSGAEAEKESPSTAPS